MPDGSRFTSRSIEDLKPREKRWIAWDPKNAGFGVRVTPNGTKSFVYSYRFKGAPRLFTIGSTPPLTLEQAHVALAEAKAKVLLARHQLIHEGVAPSDELDPATAKSKRRQLRNAAPTVEDLWTAYKRKRGPQLRSRTLTEYERMMKLHVRSELGAMKVIDVRPHDIKRTLEAIQGPVIANRVHGLLSGLFNLAKADLVLEVSPMRAVKQPTKEVPCQRALTDPELRGLYTALPQCSMSAHVRLALELTLATGVRPGEACQARWCDVDLDAKLWTVPAEFVKTKKPHAVPLSPLAVEIIEKCKEIRTHEVWIFAAARGKKAMVTSDLSTALRVSETAALLGEQKVATFTPHDLRRSCRTGLARLGIARHIAEATIGHEHRRGIEQTYDCYDLLAERRAALEAWSAHLTALRAGPNVLPMKTAA